MDFRIADTFTDSLTRLTSDEQKAVKTTAFNLQIDPANPGMQFHRLDKAKDKNFWSVRVNADIRLIVQSELVERDYTGPARVSGSAGTGKTIVALHRAAFLARTNPNARVLLTTFSDTLAGHLQSRLNRLVSGEPRLAERNDVYSIGAIARRLYKLHIAPASLADRTTARSSMSCGTSSTTRQSARMTSCSLDT